jgi:DNA-binding NarL/FixJ family response regulator
MARAEKASRRGGHRVGVWTISRSTVVRAEVLVSRHAASAHVAAPRDAVFDLPMGRAIDREVRVVEAVLVAGSEKAAAHRLGLPHSTVKHHLANARSKVGATITAQLVWILAPRPPEPEAMAETDE